MGAGEVTMIMIGILRKTALAGAFAMIAGVASARAEVVEAKVPFDFVVRGQTLPAGDYVIERDINQPSVLVIRGKEGSHPRVLVFTEPAGTHDPAGERPVLRFTQHDSQYWLADVWRSRDDGWEIESSPGRK